MNSTDIHGLSDAEFKSLITTQLEYAERSTLFSTKNEIEAFREFIRGILISLRRRQPIQQTDFDALKRLMKGMKIQPERIEAKNAKVITFICNTEECRFDTGTSKMASNTTNVKTEL